jgi:Zn-dependent protease with chaperone function
MATAVELAVCCILLLGPVPVLLARAEWPARAPRAAVMLWQVIGLTASFAAVGTGLAVAVVPLHVDLFAGVGRLTGIVSPGHPLAALNFYEAVGLAMATYVTGGLAGGLVVTLARTLRTRAHHRRILDLVGRRSDVLPGTLVLDHPEAIAYCVPGVRPRIVLSAGALGALDAPELDAVVAHERGHTHARHDLVMLPLASLIGPFRWVPYARLASRSVSTLLEMAADDFACRSHRRRVVAAALVRMAVAGTGRVPECAFGATVGTVSARVRRLLAFERNSRTVGVAALLGASAVLSAPLVCIAAPSLVH